MSKAAAKRIERGLTEAMEYTRVKHCIHDWIADDLPLVFKMAVKPEDVTKLVDRIVGSKTRADK